MSSTEVPTPAALLSPEAKELLGRFDRLWQQRPAIDDFLATCPPGERGTVLVELAHADLEFRLRAGEPARVEDYVQRYPELALKSVVASLLAVEFRQRARRDPSHDSARYVQRFPAHAALIERLVREQAGQATVIPLGSEPAAATPLFAHDAERLRLEDEIARGGMGAVFRGRDTDLGRDVAVKVLREEYARKPEWLRRFVEEAQVAAQLQHPGAVPVYALGQFPDGRPFFTMKLVKGRTLAQLLAERAAPSALPHFLRIFEQVCQALAYAHSRGVIHRDLKPANVMVGAFGEVQVMDWGLAKVLPGHGAAEKEGTVIETARGAADTGTDERETRPGQGMGTPAYVAPEQARGEVARMDERCDVFGLGAVLCEILTGQPPFTGTMAWAWEKAKAGDVADALARLAGCGADAELVDLAQRCLKPVPEERPRDAGAVAAAVTAYQEAVAERLRQTELDRAAAEATAREERKRRRVQLALAAALLLLVAGGGGGAWTWQQRRQGVDNAVGVALAEARSLFEQANREPLADTDRFALALSAARKADDLAHTGGASGSVRREASELAAVIAQEAEQAVHDRRLLADLLEVRGPREGPTFRKDDKGFLTQLAEPSADEQFTAAFRTWGLDVDATPSTEAAARLAARPAAVIVEVIAALDEWASERRRQRMPAASWQHLTDLAQTLDAPDSKRSELRTLLASGSLGRERALGMLSVALRPVPVPFDAGFGVERARLRRFLAETDAATEPVLGLLTLVQALHVAGEERLAEGLLRSAARMRPREVVLHATLGSILEGQQPPRWREAVECYAVVRGLRPGLGESLAFALVQAGRSAEGLALYERLTTERPDNPWLQTLRGNALLRQGWRKEAEAAYREALRLKLDYPQAHCNLGGVLSDQGRAKEAEAACREAIRLKPDLPEAHLNLGNALEHQGRYKEAEAACREALRLQPDDHEAHNNLGGVLNDQGRHKEAEAACREALRLQPDCREAHTNLGIALDKQGRPKEAEAAFRAALHLKPDHPKAHYNLGLVLDKQGRHKEAEAAYREALRLQPDLPQAYFNLGIALEHQGRDKEAEAAFCEAIRLQPDDPAAHTNLGVVLAVQGRSKEAEAAFRATIRLKPDDPEAHYNLGRILGEQGRSKEAEAACREAIRLKPDYDDAHNNLGSYLNDQGRHKEAEAAFREAIRLKPDLPDAHCNLGHALRAQGRFEDALASMRRGHLFGSKTPGWSHPSGDWVKRCERLVELDRKLPRILRGEIEPASDLERLELAALCQHPARRRHAAAVSLALAAFAEKQKLADDLDKQHRYDAACSAALAAAGQGEDAKNLPDKVVLTLRRQTLLWLRADLMLYAKLAEGEDADAKKMIQQQLSHWQQDADLTSVRDAEALAQFPPDERQAWQKLWADVEALRKKTSAEK